LNIAPPSTELVFLLILVASLDCLVQYLRY